MDAIPTDCLWEIPPDTLTVAPHEVHIWHAALDLSAARIEYLRGTLAEDEIQRAERFFSPQDHDHFVAARGILRAILSRYVGRPPQHLHFDYSERGKPVFAAASGQAALRFNLSHSHGRALYAIAYEREVGIDLELIRSNVACEQIAERFFAPGEYAALCARPSAERERVFFACWTMKEAFVKARGEGLWQALDDFEIHALPGAPVSMTMHGSNSQEAGRWSLREIAPHRDFAAAIAVEGHDWQLRCWQWHEN